MMETYAERLKRKENTMTNYDMDEIVRQRDREKRSRGIRPEDEDHSIEVELPHRDILKLALAAHDKNITLNQMCIEVLRQGIEDANYRFEHQSTPTVLKEY